jgi:TonB family protein
MRGARFILYLACACSVALSQHPAADDVYRVGPGITPPKLLRKVEPTYPAQARSAYVQGTVLFEAVVDTNGKLTDITLVSPLGFGLDERAQEAIERWELKPGEKDGKPVKVRANIEVNFRLLGTWYDSKEERRRTSYNLAVANLKGNDTKSVEHATRTIQELSKEKYPPAAYLHAMLLREGKLLPKDLPESAKLLLFSSEKNFGPAMYEVGRMQLAGEEVPLDAQKGLQLIHDAAVLGSTGAQLYLGTLYEAGKDAPRDVMKARRYYRLCAAAREPVCQFRLARLLLADPDRSERQYVQALAWLQLASEAGSSQARALFERERPNVTAEQNTWIASLKPQLLHGH